MPEIPGIVEEFIGKFIESVDALEILLLLRETPSQKWGASAVSRALELDSAATAVRLEELKSARLIRGGRSAANEPVYQYSPSSPEIARAVSELAAAYSTYRVRIIGMIFSKPLKKIQSFADAFRFRNHKEENE